MKHPEQSALKNLLGRWNSRVQTSRYRVGAVVDAKVIGTPGPRFMFVRPVADPELRAIVPATFYPPAWQVAGVPDVHAGDTVRCKVVEFDPKDAKTGEAKLVLDVRSARPNPFQGLTAIIGAVVAIEIIGGNREEGLIVRLVDRPDCVSRIRPDDITLRYWEAGHRYQAVVVDVHENSQAIELSMREAVRRHRENYRRPTAR